MDFEKPFKITNATYLPNQLFDNRIKSISNQQKIFLIYLWRRLYGYGDTEIKLSYSVIFNDFPCIIKNKHKFSIMINDLKEKGLIKIQKGIKKCNTYIIEEEQYNKLISLSLVNKTNKIENNNTDKNENTNKIDIGSIDISKNTLETLQYVFQYEFNKIYPNSKSDFIKNRYLETFNIINYTLNEMPNIDYTTLIRCYFLNDFDDYNKPKIEEIYDMGIRNYKEYGEIVKQVPIDNDKMLYLYKNLYDSYLIYFRNKSIDDFIENKRHLVLSNNIDRPYLFYCSKKYNKFCIDNDVINKRHNKEEIIERIKQYPVIANFVNDKLKNDSIFNNEIIFENNKTEIDNIEKVEVINNSINDEIADNELEDILSNFIEVVKNENR